MNDKPSLTHVLRDASALLEGISDTPHLDAELLAAHALGMERMEMLARLHELKPSQTFLQQYKLLLERRRAHEPLAYITGRQAFHEIELSVTPDVLIPRSDSETLIDVAEAYFADRQPPATILDLGTGSGALLLAAMVLYPEADGIGIDASTGALSVAQKNAEALGMVGRTKMLHLSWRDTGWHAVSEAPFDLILCNPPYVEQSAELSPMVAEYEPEEALYAGEDGLEEYRIIIPQIPRLLSPNGLALFEIGMLQADNVTELAVESGLSCALHNDLSGRPRCMAMHV